MLLRALCELWRVADRRQRRLAIGLVALMFVSSALEMFGMVILFAYIAGLIDGNASGLTGLFRQSFDAVFGRDELRFALFGGLIVVAFFVFKNLAAIGASFLNSRFLMKLYEAIAPRLFQAFLHAPYQRFLLRGTAEPSRLLSQMLGLFNTYFGSALQALSDGILILFVVALILFIDPLLTLLAAAMFGTALLVMHFATRSTLARMSEEALANQRKSTGTIGEAFGGLIVSRLNATTDRFVERYRHFIQRAAMMNRRQNALGQLPRLSNEVLLAAGIVATASYFRLRGEGLEAALPTLALFGFAGLRLTAALSRFSQSLQRIDVRQKDFEAFLRTAEEMVPEVVHAAPRPAAELDYLAGDRPLPDGTPTHFSEALRLTGVDYAYRRGAPPAIHAIDLTVTPRTFTAISGPSGGGKSTLLLVMLGMLRPDRGSVACDGWDIFEHLRAWHARIGYVGQRIYIPNRSVREIVAFGRPPEAIDDDRVWDALEMARLAELVHQLPNKLGSYLGEGGGRISGGQRQRLDIARALYDDPDILFLDEATAALDNITEREVTKAITRISDRKTVICVAHRLSSIRNADVIHFMENGRIVASGTYDRLLQDTPNFRKMAEAGDAGNGASN